MAGNWVAPLKTHETNSPEDDYSLPFSDNEELECLNNSRGSDDPGKEGSNMAESHTKGLMMVGGLPVEMLVTEENPAAQPSDASSRRKSSRVRKGARSYSPVLVKKKVYKKKKKETPVIVEPPPFDVLPDGTPFNCDLCRSPYICNSGRRIKSMKRPKSKATPRHKTDPNTGKVLMLCNSCGLRFDKKPPAPKPPVNPEEKEAYLKKAQAFGLWLVNLLSDHDADRLACPVFKTKGCMCLQRYITGDGESVGVNERAMHLLSLLKEAKRLSALRYNDTARDKTSQPRLCNGHKKAPEFEQYVLMNRRHLKEDLKLCERAAQRVLFYSNNFLHKRLKTDTRTFRVERVKGKSVLGLLTPIAKLPEERCCIDNCVTMALTHETLLLHWRLRAEKNQMEMRRVIAEMLTPSGGARPNCNTFIRWVTGCSCSTISKVRSQMQMTGGSREPPTHGLKKRWENIKAHQVCGRKAVSSVGHASTFNTSQSHNRGTTCTSKMKTGQQTHTASKSEPDKLQTISATRQQIHVLERQLAKQQQQLKALLSQVNAAAPKSAESCASQGSAEGEAAIAGNSLVSLMETSTSESSSPASTSRMTSPDSGLLTVSLASPQNSEGMLTNELFSTIHFILPDNQTLQNQSSVILLPTSTALTLAPGAATTSVVNASSPIAQTLTSVSSGQQTLLSLLKPEFTQNVLPVDSSTGGQHLPAGAPSSVNSTIPIINKKKSSSTVTLSSQGNSMQKNEKNTNIERDSITSLVANTLSVAETSGASTSAVINIAPRTIYPVSGTSRESQDHSGNGEENGQVEAVVQQILDLTGNVGLVSISPSKANSFLHQLSEYGSTIAPNVNISLLQPSVSDGDNMAHITLPQVSVQHDITQQALNSSMSDTPGGSQLGKSTVNPVNIPIDPSAENIDTMLDPTAMAPLKYVLTIEQGAGGDTAIPISLETVDSLESPMVFIEDQTGSSRGQDIFVSAAKGDSTQAIDFMNMLAQRDDNLHKNTSQY